MAIETVTVKRGGSFLTIPVLAVDRYVAKGYAVVDEHGEVVQSGIPNDVAALKKLCKAQEAEIAQLKARIAELEATDNQPITKEVVGTPVEEPEFEEVPKKATSKKSKKTV